MSLKDLVTDSSKLDEEAIERVISTYIKYDPAAERIIFTPSGVALSNENKILVYLTAISGWPFVTDPPPAVSSKPADLEGLLGIAGGTLRPTLKKLKDIHLLANDSGHYSIQSANLSHIESYVKGDIKPIKRKSSAKRPTSDTSEKVKRPKATKQSGGGSASSAFDKLVSEGFFDSAKTLKQLKEKLEEKGLIFPQSALSGLVLKAVRASTLTRAKIETDGRKVWAYSSHE